VHRGPEEDDIADLAAVDDVFGEVMNRVFREIVAHPRDEPALGGDGREFGRLGGRRGKRLLAVDVLAGEERRLRRLVMEVIGEADVDEIDLGIGDWLTPIRRDPRPTVDRLKLGEFPLGFID
jgi:hypothetical protein